VKRIDECKASLDDLGGQAAKSGDLDSPLQYEKLRNELDRARSRLAAAVEGYSGWFNNRTVDEKLLTQVAQQDSNLVSVVDLIGQQLLEKPIALDKLKESIALLHQRIDRRNELLKQA
jgi:phage shock protein A